MKIEESRVDDEMFEDNRFKAHFLGLAAKGCFVLATVFAGTPNVCQSINIKPDFETAARNSQIETQTKTLSPSNPSTTVTIDYQAVSDKARILRENQRRTEDDEKKASWLFAGLSVAAGIGLGLGARTLKRRSVNTAPTPL
jgi:hypothetical protein